MRSAATLVALAGFLLPAGAADFPLKDLAAARKLNLVKCTKCHKLYEPEDYNSAEWNTWMEKMARKSKLKAQQTELLNRYFDLRRTGAIQGEKKSRK